VDLVFAVETLVRCRNKPSTGARGRTLRRTLTAITRAALWTVQTVADYTTTESCWRPIVIGRTELRVCEASRSARWCSSQLKSGDNEQFAVIRFGSFA